MTLPTRRRFLKGTATVFTATTLSAGSPVRASKSALERVNLGIVGCGGRSRGLATSFNKLSNAHIAGLCDVDESRVNGMAKFAPNAKKWTDMRRMFDSPEIDAVVIATCNHWHCLAAVWAMQAGKHVYVEKPLGHTEWEGEQVVNAAAKFNLICQVGTQQRSDPMQAEIKQFLHTDKAIGDIESIRVNRFGVRKTIGFRSTPLTPPVGVDYNLWLGPAADIPMHRKGFHYDWHWVWNTGSGEMGNWGVHILDDVRNNLLLDEVSAPSSLIAAGGRYAWKDAGETPNVHYALLDAGGVPVVVALSNLEPTASKNVALQPSTGYIAYGSEGRFHGARGWAAAFDGDGKLIREFHGDSGNDRHQQNFVDAIVLSDASMLAAPAQVGHDSTTWCNLINIATRVPSLDGPAAAADAEIRFGTDSAADVLQEMSTIANGEEAQGPAFSLGPQLTFDPQTRRFTGAYAGQANTLLRREYREPFVVPSIEPVAAVSAS